MRRHAKNTCRNGSAFDTGLLNLLSIVCRHILLSTGYVDGISSLPIGGGCIYKVIEVFPGLDVDCLPIAVIFGFALVVL